MNVEKSRLRQSLRQRLALLQPARRTLASQKLARRLVELEVWKSARAIGLFGGRHDEMETTLLWKENMGARKTFWYPRIEGAEFHYHEVRGLDSLQIQTWDLQEPVGGKRGVPDLVTIPGFGFDRNGGRLGRGKGFYDRWLAAHPETLRLGVCFDFQVVESVPMEPHDCRMDFVVTETEFYSIPR